MKNNQRGSITLETSIVLPIFIFIFMLIYGLFGVLNTRNQTAHALAQASTSLSMDSYLNDKVKSAAEVKTKFWGEFSDMVIDFARLGNDKYFSSSSDWYETMDTSVMRDRFIGYLVGGDEAAAREYCEKVNIVGGLDGISFEAEMSGDDDLTITISYEVQTWFDYGDLGKFPIKQSVTTHMWRSHTEED